MGPNHTGLSVRSTWVHLAFVPAGSTRWAQPHDVAFMIHFRQRLRAEASSCFGCVLEGGDFGVQLKKTVSGTTMINWVAAPKRKFEQSPQSYRKGWEHILCRAEEDDQQT